MKLNKEAQLDYQTQEALSQTLNNLISNSQQQLPVVETDQAIAVEYTLRLFLAEFNYQFHTEKLEDLYAFTIYRNLQRSIIFSQELVSIQRTAVILHSLGHIFSGHPHPVGAIGAIFLERRTDQDVPQEYITQNIVADRWIENFVQGLPQSTSNNPYQQTLDQVLAERKRHQRLGTLKPKA